MSDDMKLCKKCGQEKPLDGFHRTAQRKDGSWSLHPICKICAKEKSRAYYLANIERMRSEGVRKQKERREAGLDVETTRRRRLRQKYSISLEDYERMLVEQEGQCAVCGTTAPGWPSVKNEFFQVDHDHATGMVRGLLCGACNRAIGMMGDDPSRLERAAKYLRRSSPSVEEAGPVEEVTLHPCL